MAKVLLISPNKEKNPLVFPLGIGYIRAALLQDGYEVGILDFGHLELEKGVLRGYLSAFEPDFTGISIRNLDNCCMQRPRSFIGDVKSIVSWIKEWNGDVPVVLGGSGFSLLPEEWMKYSGADYGIVGDGTRSIGMLLGRLEKKEALEEIPGLMFFSNQRLIKFEQEWDGPIDEIGIPSRAGFLHELKNQSGVRHNIQTKRGCALHCSYCAYPHIEGRRMRLRSPDKVVDEIQQMIEEHRIHEFDFVDSVFNFPLDHAAEICKKMIERKLDVSWGCFLNPGFISQEFVELLKASKCSGIEFGIDAGNDICLEAMGKSFRKKQIREAVQMCRNCEVPFSFCLLIGGPQETVNTLHETLQFIEELEVEHVFGLLGVRILPNTGIYDEKFSGSDEEELFKPRFYFSELLSIEQALAEINRFQNRHPGWIFV